MIARRARAERSGVIPGRLRAIVLGAEIKPEAWLVGQPIVGDSA